MAGLRPAPAGGGALAEYPLGDRSVGGPPAGRRAGEADLPLGDERQSRWVAPETTAWPAVRRPSAIPTVIALAIRALHPRRGELLALAAPGATPRATSSGWWPSRGTTPGGPVPDQHAPGLLRLHRRWAGARRRQHARPAADGRAAAHGAAPLGRPDRGGRSGSAATRRATTSRRSADRLPDGRPGAAAGGARPAPRGRRPQGRLAQARLEPRLRLVHPATRRPSLVPRRRARRAPGGALGGGPPAGPLPPARLRAGRAVGVAGRGHPRRRAGERGDGGDGRPGSAASQRGHPAGMGGALGAPGRRGERAARRPGSTPPCWAKRTWDAGPGRFVAFDLLAAGPRRGTNQYNNREDDLGPAPMGIAGVLAGTAPRDRTPPHTIHHPQYFGAGRR